MVLVILINRIAIFQVESAIQLLTIRFCSMFEILESQLPSRDFNCSVRLWLCREVLTYCFIPYDDCCSLQILTCYFRSGDIPLGPRGTQRQFLENICSEDDLRSRIIGTFVVTFLACLSLLGFSNI